MSKSHVSFEQKVCKVTGKPYDTDALLLDKRIDRKTGGLKKSLERNTITGWGISPEYQKQIDNDFIIMIGCDESKSELLPNGNVSPAGAYRTGDIISIKREAFTNIFDVPSDKIGKEGICFTDDKVIKFLKELHENI